MVFNFDRRFILNTLFPIGVSLLLFGILLNGLAGSVTFAILPKVATALRSASLSLVLCYLVAGVIQTFFRVLLLSEYSQCFR